MAVEQLAEVRLAQPAVDARAHLDADDLRDGGRAAEPRGEVDLAEAALAEQPLDPVAEPCFRAVDDFADREQAVPAIARNIGPATRVRVVAAVSVLVIACGRGFPPSLAPLR